MLHQQLMGLNGVEIQDTEGKSIWTSQWTTKAWSKGPGEQQLFRMSTEHISCHSH